MNYVEIIHTASQGDNNALELLHQWSSDINSLPEMLSLFEMEDSTAQFYAITAIRQLIDNYWYLFDNSTSNKIQQTLIAGLQKSQQPTFTQAICKSLGNLEFYVWPAVWPSFFTDVITNSSTNGQMLVLMSYFADALSQSSRTNLSRRDFIIKTLNECLENLIPTLQANVSIPLLQLLQSVTNIIYPSSPIFPQIITILFQMTTVPGIDEKAFLCLHSMFDTASDSQYAPMMFAFLTQNLENESTAFAPFLCYVLNSLVYTLSSVEGFPPENLIPLYLKTLENASREVFQIEFWHLWVSLISSWAACLDWVSVQIDPILPNIITTFYELLPHAVIECRLVSEEPSQCFTMLASCGDGLVTFLSQQPFSPSLCYAVGLVGNTSYPFLTEVVPKICSLFDADPPSVLFALSRVVTSCPDVIGLILTSVLNFVFSNNPPLVSMAVNCLKQMTQTSALDHIGIDFCTALMSQLSPDDVTWEQFLALILCLIRIINHQKDDNHAQLLAQNALAILSADIFHGLQVINQISRIHSPLVVKHFWAPLLAIINQAASTGDIRIFSEACHSFIMCCRYVSWSECSAPCQALCQFLIGLNAPLDVIISTVSGLRRSHSGIDAFRPQFLEKLKQFDVANPPTAFFEFFTAFDINDDEAPVVAQSAAHALVALDYHTCRVVMKIINLQGKADRFLAFHPQFVFAIVSSLGDCLHKQLIQKLLNLLHFCLQTLAKNGQNVHELLAAAIDPHIDNKELIASFVGTVLEQIRSLSVFDSIFKEFMIEVGWASIADIKSVSNHDDDDDGTTNNFNMVVSISGELNEDEYVSMPKDYLSELRNAH